MEFHFGDMNIERMVARTSAQTSIEGALPLPAGRRLSDTEIVCCSASASVTKATAAEGMICVEGRLSVNVICRESMAAALPSSGSDGGADGEQAEAERAEQAQSERGGAFTSSAAFKYNVAMDAVHEGMRAEVSADVVSIELRSGMELTVEAAVQLECSAFMAEPVRALDGIARAQCEFMRTDLLTFNEKAIGSSETAFEAEAALPAGAEPIFATGEAFVRDVNTGSDTAMIEGQLMIKLIMLSGGGIMSHIMQLPFSIEADLDERAAGDTFAFVNVNDIDVRPLDASSGMGLVKAVLSAEVFASEQTALCVPSDAFIPKEAFVSVLEPTCVICRLKRKNFRCTVNETVQLPENSPSANAVICCFAMPYVTNAYVKSSVLSVEGVIFMRCALRTASGAVLSFPAEVPFLCETQYQGQDCDSAFARVRCLSASISLATNEQGALNVECALDISAVPYCVNELNVLTGMTECEPVKRSRQVIMYFASEGETAFDIAKRYSLPVKSVLEAACQDQPSGKLHEGDRLIFLS